MCRVCQGSNENASPREARAAISAPLSPPPPLKQSISENRRCLCGLPGLCNEQLLQPGSYGSRTPSGSESGGGGGGGGGGGAPGAKGGAALRVCRLRGNDWDTTIPRWPEGILLNRCTDLALVDLPGTAYMTSRDGARRLLHAVHAMGDVPLLDVAAVAGGSGGLLARAGRPPTAASPRVVARTTTRWAPVLGGGGVDLAPRGFAALSLEAAPVPCVACAGRYPVCLCVASCPACGRFNAERKVALPRRAGRAGGGEGGACKGCGLTEAQAMKFRNGAAVSGKAHAAAQAAAVARDKREASERLGFLAGRDCGPGSPLGGTKGDAQGLRALHPPLPTDLLRVPTSQAVDSFDPYADNFPF